MNQLVENPFNAGNTLAQRESSGSRQMQSREMAETQAKYMMAQHFPRDVIGNVDKIMNAFTRPNLAEKSQYQFARGGSDIVGPSIRAAEAIAQQWGNMEFGFRELARNVGADGVPYSEVEAFAVDLESRNRRPMQFIVKHWRDTKKGGYKLTDERDIYELVANQAQRRVRPGTDPRRCDRLCNEPSRGNTQVQSRHQPGSHGKDGRCIRRMGHYQGAHREAHSAPY
jgi:hypothetical protein